MKRVQALKIGDPLDEHTQIGPLARKDIMDKLLDQFERIKKHGNAKILLGGKQVEELSKGNYVYPTIIETQDLSNPAFREELFGPV